MRANDWEFRQRFWLIGGIFTLGFGLSAIDRVNVGVALLRLAAPAGFVVDTPAGRAALRAVFSGGALVAAAAAMLRTWAAAYLDSAVVHDTRLHAEGVVADGPYRFLRNPLYLGTILLGAGMGVLASRLGWLVIVGGLTFFVLRLVGREEAELAARQGERYAAYRAAVPRLLPALRPRVPASGARPRWGQAFLGESFVWSFALAIVAFIPRFDQRWFFLFLGLGLLASFLFKLRAREKETAPGE